MEDTYDIALSQRCFVMRNNWQVNRFSCAVGKVDSTASDNRLYLLSRVRHWMAPYKDQRCKVLKPSFVGYR